MTNRLSLSSRLAVSAFCACAFFVTMALPTIAQAQATTPPTTDQTTTTTTTTTSAPVPTPDQVTQAGAAAPSEEAVTKLPPFEVESSSHDTGYYTQNTLAGTRLNSNLADLGASITVITKQQMTDTSSVNINDLFLYEASTEGDQQYENPGSTSKGTGTGDSNQSSPQTSNRIRGLGAVDVSRDFFITNPAIQVDSYNVDDVELDRGPNSTLFGIGSASGILNESIEKAVLNQDTNEVAFRYGSFDQTRLSFNINRALIPDKLSVAVAYLYNNSVNNDEKPAYNIQRREFAAITLKPFPKTTIHANIEFYDNPADNPAGLTATDEVTPWLENGSPKWDPITYSATVNGVTQAPLTNNNSAAFNQPAGLVSSLGNEEENDPNMYIVHGQLQLWEQAELGTNFDNVGSPTLASGAFGPIGLEREMESGGNYLKFNSAAPAGQVTYPLFREPGVTSKQIYNYQGINMLSANYTNDKAEIYNVELEQEIVDNLFLEVGWYREQLNRALDNSTLAANAGLAIQVDPNTRFLNGTPDTYFGEPYVVGQQPGYRVNEDLNEQERISLVYQLDFTKNSNWTKWLGHHNLLWFYQHRENDTNAQDYDDAVIDGHSWNSTTDIAGQNVIGGALQQKFFLSNGGSAVSFSPGVYNNTAVYSFPVTWYNTQLNGGTWTNEPVKVGSYLESGTNTQNAQQQIWSYSGSMQNYLFNDRLVLTFGQRHDYERSRLTDNLPIDPTTGLTDVSNLSQWSNWVNADGITRQAGGVLHIFKWLSVHYNQSDNFSVGALGEDFFGNVLATPTGQGKDYGLSTSLFDDKLVAELNWYKSNAQNSRTGDSTVLSRTGNLDTSMFIPWAQEIATNNLGVGATGTAINTYAQTIVQLPTGFQNFINGRGTLNDTQSVAAKGWEFNLIYNPMRNWTMKFTADQDAAAYSNVYPHLQNWIAARLPIWVAAKDPVLGVFWTTACAGNVGNFTGGGLSAQEYLAEDVDAAGLDQFIAEQGQISPDLAKYHFNYLTDYHFVTGKLAGFGIGGALRYTSPAAIGYLGAPPDPSAQGAIDSLNVEEPVWSKEVLHQDMWVSYTFRMPFISDRMRTSVQFNVRDMWSNGYLVAAAVNPDGSPNAFRIIPPRQYYLTVKFDF
jgi:outer membrane receptor protein involved in Fe transport